MINFYHRNSAHNQKMMLYTMAHNTEGEPSAIASFLQVYNYNTVQHWLCYFIIIIVLY